MQKTPQTGILLLFDDLDGTVSETQYWRFVFLCFADMREKPSTDRAFMILWT